jgi:predicted amidophosphoribosyltransferase
MREQSPEPDSAAAIALAEDPPLTCQVCGAAQDSRGAVLCAACGEPVLRWGWAP